jgi:hypothetical protein
MFPFNSQTNHPSRVSQVQLQALLSIYQQDSLTGMVRLTPIRSNGDFFVLLYVDGQNISIYQHVSENYIRHEVQDRNAILPKGELDLSSLQFSSRFIRSLRGMFERANSKQMGKINTQSVAENIKKLEQNPEPLLAHLHWPSADGFVLIPGLGFSSRQMLFWSPEHSSGIPNFARWPEPECTLTTYSGSTESKAWRENYLMLGLDFLYEQIFNRYNDLVGSGMANRLEDHLNSVARMQGWKISFSGHTLDDVHFFTSLSDMRIAYRTLFMAGQRHITSVVGERLFEESARAALVALPTILKTTIENDNIFTYQIK